MLRIQNKAEMHIWDSHTVQCMGYDTQGKFSTSSKAKFNIFRQMLTNFDYNPDRKSNF